MNYREQLANILESKAIEGIEKLSTLDVSTQEYNITLQNTLTSLQISQGLINQNTKGEE